MPFSRIIKSKTACVKVNGKMTAYEAASLREEFIECLENYDGLILDLESVDGFDTTGLQLLLSSKKTAEDLNKIFTVSGASTAIINFLSRAGVDPGGIPGMEKED